MISRTHRPDRRYDRSAWLPAIAALMLTCGCAVGPDFSRPPAPGVHSYTREPLPAQTASADVHGGAAQRFLQGMDIPRRWWMVFESAELNNLVEEALKANPDVTSAQAALRQAMENFYAQRGVYFPTVQANYSATRQKNAVGTLAPTLNSGEPLFNLHTAQVSVSYLLDVFGGSRRQVESLQAQAEVQRFQLEATYLTLAGNVVAAAVQEASLRRQLRATREVIRLQQETLELNRKQYELGAIAQADVVSQEAALAQTQASVPPLQKQLAQQRDLLTRLLGRFPSDEPLTTFEISKLHLPQELPMSLPAKLVEQRPDVRAAEAAMHAASAQVGVAVANMLPQINLTAGAGGAATDISSLFTTNTAFWTLGASLTQTLFAGGELLHKKHAAQAALDQAGAQYRSAVLTAFQNVADALHALRYDADTVKAQVAAVRSAEESLAISRRALALGSISYLSLLNAERTYQQAVINLAQAQGSRYADTAALFQALGGGWWNASNEVSRASQRWTEPNRARGDGAAHASAHLM